MIYNNLKIHQQINSLSQIEEDTSNYERFFKVQNGDVVVDIGAHVGMFTKNHVNKASKIIALEPDPLFFKELQKYSKSNIFITNYAISKDNGVAYIKSDGNANSIDIEQKNNSVLINTISFKELLNKYNLDKIDFLKIDCEGGEYDIFNDENVFWLSNNCKNIAGEFHIHNAEHRAKLPLVLFYFEKHGLPFKLTSIDGVLLTKEQVLKHLDYYKEIMFYVSKDLNSKYNVNMHCVNGLFLELSDWPEHESYNVKMINNQTNDVLFESNIKNNYFSKAFCEYYIDWKIVISHNNKIIKTIQQDLKDKHVYIAIESKSLGDNLAWFPYVEEFRKKHQCRVSCSTFFNDLFKENYPDVNFIEPGTIVPNIYAQYNIGWFYTGEKINHFKHPFDPRKQPMQKTASDILGLEYKEIKPKLKLPTVEKVNTVTLGIHSTAQAKYWNNPKGWQEVVDYINSINYIPLLLSREPDGYMFNYNPKNIMQPSEYSLTTLIRELCKSKVFIGVGSGLSWLAWACNIPVILISGFSDSYTEMSNCYRISANSECSGCFNKFKLNAGDWNWCPVHKGTERQFECSKQISSNFVINNLKYILNESTN